MPGFTDPVVANFSQVAAGFGFFRHIQPSVGLALTYPGPGPDVINFAPLVPPNANAAVVRLALQVVGGALGSLYLSALVSGDYQETVNIGGPGVAHRQAILYFPTGPGNVTFSWGVSGMGGAAIGLGATLIGYYEG